MQLIDHSATPDPADILDINLPSRAKQILGRGGSITELSQPPARVHFTDELKQARQIYGDFYSRVSDVFRSIDNDLLPEILPLVQPIHDINRSIQRNASAFEWIVLTNPDDMSIKQHSINVSILAMLFGHHIGLPEPLNHELGLAGLTLDLGKLLIPQHILNKSTTLDEAEMSVMQLHPEAGVKVLRAIKGVSPAVINVCLRHHERLDGSGYPACLKDEEIDLFSRIIGIIDSYVAITSAKHHSGFSPPGRALNELYKLRGNAYDGELVEAFIRSHGEYPIGTTLETRAGEIGMVISNDDKNRLSPLVLMILDAQKCPLNEETIIDFSRRDDQGRLVHSIKQAVNPDIFEINPKDYFRDV